MPRLTSARRRRSSASASAPTRAANSSIGSGPPARASATPSWAATVIACDAHAAMIISSIAAGAGISRWWIR
ncbi:hypothetical protein AWC14_06005 [Mycobacterium kyorinense]|uniref:Uncharacterized protein n=1 Tax=Mycobacterium kyorinense TaxID=487514 RepID=A0A1X1XVE2_9MYCO|nr:hypothetical protein AWC14_06005 [Mycobacterium kyorinense]